MAVDQHLGREGSREGKRKIVWGRKPNGLYGWKVVQGPQTSGNPKENKHTLTSPKPSQKATKSFKQTSVLKKWLLTPNIVVGVGR
jgi:hypothetical protein